VIELEDYLFFSSTEKGKVAETAPLLHNYALAYALSWVASPYYYEVQAPEYANHLQPLNEEGVYIFPAAPVDVTHRLMQYNTTPEPFLMTRAQSLGYPNWGFIKCIRPGSRFETYALSQKPLAFPRRIRLGKWMSQARLDVEEMVLEHGKGKRCTAMINVQDLPKIPTFFTSMYNVLPTRLILGAEWEEEVEGYRVGKVFLPEAAFWWR
jgi:CRISPR-associated protein Csc1